MKSRAVRLLSVVAAISFWSVAATLARAEESDSAALAAAMKSATATLQGGLRVSEAQGTPISAKFEIENDADDLKEGASQKAAIAKAKVPLLTATETAVNANAGSRAVSIVPELKNGQATAR